MATVETSQRLENVLRCIRPAVRNERPYLVGGVHQPPVKLNQNESPYDLPSNLKREIAERFREIPANRYPSEQPWELRERLASYLGAPPESILLGNGSNELSHTFGLALIEPGDAVVLPRPMFSLYEKVVRLHSGRVLAVAPRGDLSFDAEALLDAVTREQPPLTVITSPNNPTGLAMSRSEIERIVDAADGLVLVDEAYWEFNDEAPATTLLDRYPNLVILRTFSKAMGLAGMRIGYMIGHPDVVAEFMKARLPFMVDRFSEAAALALLDHPELIARRIQQIRTSLRDLRDGLAAIPEVTALPSSANFLLFRTGEEPSLLIDRLASADVLVRSMSGYPELRGFLRVNAGTPDENKAFLAALKRAL